MYILFTISGVFFGNIRLAIGREHGDAMSSVQAT